MNYSIANLNKKHLLSIAVISLTAAYLIGSRALDTGSLWQYLLSFILVIVSIRYFIRTIIKNHRGHKN